MWITASFYPSTFGLSCCYFVHIRHNLGCNLLRRKCTCTNWQNLFILRKTSLKARLSLHCKTVEEATSILKKDVLFSSAEREDWMNVEARFVIEISIRVCSIILSLNHMWQILFTLRNINFEVHGEEHICKRVSSSMACGGKSKESKLLLKRLENKLEWGKRRAGKSACCCAPRLFGIRTQLNLLESAVPLNFFDVLNRHALQGDAPVLAYRHQFHWQGSLPHLHKGNYDTFAHLLNNFLSNFTFQTLQFISL